MNKKIILGLFTFICISIAVSIIPPKNAEADSGSGRGGRRAPAAPEPISMALFAAGGATLVGIQRLRAKRRLKDLDDNNS